MGNNLYSRCEALGSILSPAKKKEEQERGREPEGTN